MPTAVRGPEGDVRRHLLGRLHRIEKRLPVAKRSAATLVDDERRVDEVVMILEQPVDAVGAAAFLVGGERDDDVAVGDDALAHHPDRVGDEDRRHCFIVGGAAAVVVPVTLREHERIEVG